MGTAGRKRELAIVTGASTGIGLELAKECAKAGFDLLIAADAKVGFETMMRGEAGVVAGWKNELQAAASHVLPGEVLAEVHRKQAEPGTARK